jgi:hypothetical protein
MKVTIQGTALEQVEKPKLFVKKLSLRMDLMSTPSARPLRSSLGVAQLFLLTFGF